MPKRDDLMFGEVDRQLEEVREQANALATRSVIVVTAVAVAAAALSSRIQRESADYSSALWPLGVALLAAMVSILPNLKVGPTNAALSGWQAASSAQTVTQIYLAKLGVLEANKQRLAIMTCAFYVALIAALVAHGNGVNPCRRTREGLDGDLGMAAQNNKAKAGCHRLVG